jgi:hypothetical protein
MLAISAASKAANGDRPVEGVQLATIWKTNSAAKECEICQDSFTLLKRK